MHRTVVFGFRTEEYPRTGVSYINISVCVLEFLLVLVVGLLYSVIFFYKPLFRAFVHPHRHCSELSNGSEFRLFHRWSQNVRSDSRVSGFEWWQSDAGTSRTTTAATVTAADAIAGEGTAPGIPGIRRSFHGLFSGQCTWTLPPGGQLLQTMAFLFGGHYGDEPTATSTYDSRRSGDCQCFPATVPHRSISY